MMKYGIVQGRLLPAVGEFIQNSPNEDWKTEFDIAKKVGASHIEWIDGAPNETKRWLCDVDDVDFISAVCYDKLVSLSCEQFLSSNSKIRDLLKVIVDKKIKRVVLPFLEKASLLQISKDDTQYLKTVDMIRNLCSAYRKLSFSIECDLDVVDMCMFIDDVAMSNMYITFDTGNLTRLGYDLNAHIFGYVNLIDNVHIKDAKKFGQSVKLGTGDIDTDAVRTLMKTEHVKFITFQTARDPSDEIDAFKHNVSFMENLCT